MALRSLSLLACAVLIGTLLSVQPATVPPARAATVPLDGFVADMVFSANGSRLYTADWRNDAVVEIDATTGVVLRTIDVQFRPNSIAMAPDGRSIVTGHDEMGGLTVISLPSGVRRDVAVTRGIDDIAFSSNGRTLYFTAGSYWLGLLPVPSYSGYRTVDAGGELSGISAQPGGRYLWLTESYPTPFHIYRFDSSANRITSMTANGSVPGGSLAFPAGGERVFGPTDSGSSPMWALDTAVLNRWRWIASDDIADGANVVTTLDRSLVVGTTTNDWVNVVDPLTERIVDRLDAGGMQGAIAVRPGNGEIWVSTESGLQRFAAPVRAVPRAGTDVTVTRISGSDRYATAAAISRRAYPSGTGTVYLASGRGYADALSAVPAAAVNNAPVLLTGAALPSATRSELRRLAPQEVVIIGGTAAVPNAVVKAVRSALPGVIVRRLAGADRYATSRAIVADTWPGTASTMVVATGRNFYDALSAAPYAGSVNAPLLLVDGLRTGPNGNPALDSATLSTISRLRPTTRLVVGDSKTVTADVWRTVIGTSLEPMTERRMWGTDRYRTNQHMNGFGFDDADTVYIASGTDYPDALAGGVLAAAGDDPLFLVPGNCVPRQVLWEIDRLGATDVVLLGGTSVLTSRVASLRRC